MIKIINNKCQIPYSERVLGVCEDNETNEKLFQIDRYYNDVDLGEYSPVIKIEPINSNEVPYYDILDKYVTNDKINLTWKITLNNTKTAGKLKFNIYFGKTEVSTTKVYQTQVDYFEVEENVDAKKQGETIPVTIFEKAVIESTKQANLAKQYRDEIVNNVGNLSKLTTIDKTDSVCAINELNYILKGLESRLKYLENFVGDVDKGGYEFLVVSKENNNGI